MHKYRYRAIPEIESASVYADGKRAFMEGQNRAYNPYTTTNLALAAIWWHGWDTGEEEQGAVQSGTKP